VSFGPRPWHRLQTHSAHWAPEPAQLALDHAAVRAEVQVAPALDAPVVDLQVAAGLPAARADTSPAAQPDDDDDALAAKTDIDDRCSGQAQQPVEYGGDAHVVLLVSR
jgi:hypothetical protein